MKRITKRVRLDYRLAPLVTTATPIAQRFISGTDKVLEFASREEATRFLLTAKLMWTEGTKPDFI